MECTRQENALELTPVVEVETTHPVDGSLVTNFRRSIIVAELRRPEVARR